MTFLISRTPFRISFFGGGTDYPDWYLKEGGAVLSTTIDKYCYLTCRYLPPFFPNAYRVVWTHIEVVSHINEILHPAVREGLLMMGFEGGRGLEIHHQGDLPARAGMASSSAFANGLLLVLSAIQGRPFDQEALYLKAIELEQLRLRENVGSQDQVATAVGGLNIIRFGKDGKIGVEPLRIDSARKSSLQSNLMLFYAGSQRMATKVAADVVANLHKRSVQLRRMHDMVGEARGILTGNGSLDDFGLMLDETWQLKRGIATSVSSDAIDSIYKTACANGALGGKLLGAGGTGFVLFYVPREKQDAVRRALPNLMHVPFSFEDEGSVLILNETSDRDTLLDGVPDRKKKNTRSTPPVSGTA